MNDAQLLALNVFEEARGESPAGRAAIARVVKNRMAARFMSDGTVAGTVLAKDQFSWAWFAFTKRFTGNAAIDKAAKAQYLRVCATRAQAEQRAEKLLRENLAPNTLAACAQVAAAVMAGAYRAPDYADITDEAVSYLNPRILTRLPKWATPEKLVCRIGNHDFYRK